MPMILLTVPSSATLEELTHANTAITTAARNEGVQGGITIWPIKLAIVPKRLLLEYKSRQDPPNDKNILAQVLASAAERAFNIQVEAVVIKLDSETTGLHITPKP